MQIKIDQDEKKGSAKLMDGEIIAAEMTYSVAGPQMIIIDHTEVGEDYRGLGIGRRVLDALVEKARKEEFKIMPLCPYARSEFQKDPSIRDVMR